MIIKKKLITDVSSEQIRNVTEILKKNHIAYEIKTISNQSYGTRVSNARYGMQYAQNSYDNPVFIYIVYVKPGDYKAAKELIR